jgi:hypothetical protein
MGTGTAFPVLSGTKGSMLGAKSCLVNGHWKLIRVVALHARYIGMRTCVACPLIPS